MKPEGLAVRHLEEAQRAVLMQLIGAFARTLRPELAAQRLARVEKGGADAITFAWAGRTPPAGDFRGPYYFRIQGPLFLIEFDRTQNRGNHAHAVWRDYEATGAATSCASATCAPTGTDRGAVTPLRSLDGEDRCNTTR
jgi:hypothetical protein